MRSALDRPAQFAHSWDDLTLQNVMPFYHNQVAADHARVAEMDAARTGIDPPVNNSPLSQLIAAASLDPDLFRGLIEIVTCLAFPHEVLQRSAIIAKIQQHILAPAPAPPGPTRPELLALLAG